MEHSSESNLRNRLEALRKYIRYKVRFVLAIAFWIHAIGITHFIRIRFAGEIPEARVISEAIILVIIFFYSYLASNGWWSLFFDVGYVYAFPLWMVAKYGWKLTKHTAAPVGRHLLQSAATLNPAPSPASQQANKVEDSSPAGPRDSLARPFQQFALLWCGLILLSHTKALTVFGIFVVMLALVKTVISMNGFLNGSMAWLTKVQNRMAELLNKTIEQAMQQDPASKEFRNSAVSIRFYEGALRWLCNRDGVENWVQGATLLLLVPYYVYFSILSGFIYLGIAKISAVAWPAREALVDAMFMPIAWTDLPHNLAIRSLAGLQVCVLAFISYEAIFRRISNKADTIAAAAEELTRKLANPALQSKILVISQPTASSLPGSATAAKPPTSPETG